MIRARRGATSCERGAYGEWSGSSCQQPPAGRKARTVYGTSFKAYFARTPYPCKARLRVPLRLGLAVLTAAVWCFAPRLHAGEAAPTGTPGRDAIGDRPVALERDTFSVRILGCTPRRVDLEEAEGCTIAYDLSQPARLILLAYDIGGRRAARRVWESPAGEGRAVWDLEFDYGKPANGAYAFTLEAVARDGRRALYTPPLADSRDRLRIKGVNADMDNRMVKYSLTAWGIVRIRLFRDSIFARTLQPWRVEPPGQRELRWEPPSRAPKTDEGSHALRFSAYQLPPNVIVCTGARGESPARTEQEVPQAGGRLRLFYQAPSGPGTDPRVKLAFLGADGRPLKEKAPAASGPLQARMTMHADDQRSMTDDQFNICVYVDGEVLLEDEEGIIPYNFTLDPKGLDAGAHYVMVVAISTKGRMGTASLAFTVPEKGR